MVVLFETELKSRIELEFRSHSATLHSPSYISGCPACVVHVMKAQSTLSPRTLPDRPL